MTGTKKREQISEEIGIDPLPYLAANIPKLFDIACLAILSLLLDIA